MYCLTGFSQSSPSFSAPRARHYFFNHFTTTSGLVSYQTNTAVQDEDGYIWIGTNDGLQRFDGVRFKTFRHHENDPSTLPSDLIFQLLIDKEKNLWVLTTDGKAGIFNTRTFTFSAVTIRIDDEAFFLSNAPYKRLITDEFGNIFLLVPGSEVVTYNKTSQTFSFGNNFPGLKKNVTIRAFAQQPGTHKYWIYCDEWGLAVYNHTSGKWSSAGNNSEKEKAVQQLQDAGNISNLYFDKKGRLWVISTIDDTPSVSCYDMHQQQTVISKYHFDKRSLGFHQINHFFEQRDSTLWIIGQQIFSRYLEKEKQFEQVYNGYEEEHGIDYITITCLMEDRENGMWTCTANNGIFRYNTSKDFFSNIKYVSHTTNLQGAGAPVSFMEDRDSTVLVGIRDDGFYRFDKNLEQLPLNIKGIADKNTTVIWDMFASPDSNTIWMAAQHGLYKYDHNKKSASYFQPAILSNKTVRHVVEDKKGRLWVGTQEAGVFKWDPEKGKINFENGLSSFKSIPPVKINRIINDKRGYIWVATNGEGVYMIDLATDSIHRHFHSMATGSMKLPEKSALSVLDYNDSLVIIGSNNRLVVHNRFQNKTYLLGGSLSGYISSIEKDDNGHLWVSTATSLYRVTVSNRVFVQFTRNDGLGNDYFLLGASHVLPDKRMLFGVYGMMIAFLPSAINTNPMVPDLQITGFMVKDKSLRIDSVLKQKIIVLKPQENSLVIDLSVLSYNAGYLLRYQLEGLDKDWKTVDQNYQLVYSYLPPGKYTLRVKTIDADGIAGEKTLQLSIRINSPFWKTWWFYSALLLLLFLFLFWLDKQRMKRRNAIQRMRSNIAANLHSEVNTALNKINILSEMANLKADNNPEKSKEFIGQIHIKSEDMIIAMDDMLWSIDPANDSMLKTIERLTEFIDTVNNGQNADVEMVVDKTVEKLKLDMQLRHETLLLLKNYIQSQIQHGCRNIKMHIHYEKSNLIYSSEFNIEFCNIKQLKNFFSSKEMAKKLKAIHAKLNIDVNKSNMLVVVKFPVE